MGQDPKTVEGHKVPDGDAPLGTLQVRAGQPLPESTPPIMPTMRGDASRTATAPPAMPPARYEIGAEIARGGMGRVVEATDTVLGRIVALKEALSNDPDTLKRFARETRITARLEHPSIVPVHDGGTSPNGTPYYVMRKVSGRPLEKLVATGESLDVRLRLIPHIVATAQAIAHAHERGIVHRDIKPSNILVGDLGETIVIDWGLAKVIGEVDDAPTAPGIEPVDSVQTRAGIVFGTPGFMAPEQLRGKTVDPRCDVYALGATLYHLLSRKPPHHAKTADEMMKAAVNAPPTPIGDLISGVPPELSTIIDKSLAYDPEHRYQDARELAEDLQRFLTGQLVASHHYTTGERVARYVKMHKVPFIAVGVALLALIVGGTIAVRRVVKERDLATLARTDAENEKKIAEEKKREAELKNEELTLSHARGSETTNPTGAVAMVKPLVGHGAQNAAKHAREVRTIAAAARAAGVAWGFDGSPGTTSLEMSSDGLRVLAAGSDGVVRVHDLEQRTTRTLVDRASSPVSVEARFADEERKVITWHETTLSIIEIASGTPRVISARAPILDLVVVGMTAYWVDAKGALWKLDLAGTNPIQVSLDELVHGLAASPDGRWLALAGASHLLLFDRTQPTLPPEVVTSGRTFGLDWSKDGSHLAALVEEEVLEAVDIRMLPAPQIIHRYEVGERGHVLMAGGKLYTINATGVVLGSRDGSRTRHPLTRPVGLDEARGDTLVAGSEESIAILSEHSDHTLTSPAGRISMIRASPRSPYVVAALEGRVLAWNLDDIQPRRVARDVANARFITADDLIATSIDGPARWIDLKTGNVRELGEWPALVDVVASPSGQYAVAIDIGHQARLIAAGKNAELLEGTVDRAGFATDNDLLLVLDSGSITLHDVTTAKRTKLVARKTSLLDVAWARPWVTAMFADGTLWRKNLSSGAETTASLPPVPASRLAITEAGDVFVAVNEVIYRWTGDDRPAKHASLAKKIAHLGTTGSPHAVAVSTDGAAHLVDLVRPSSVRALAEVLMDPQARDGDQTVEAMSAMTGLIAFPSRGTVQILDPLTAHRRWSLAATNTPGTTFADIQISGDGRRVLARISTTLYVWTLDLPATPAETGAWLDKMTNAKSNGLASVSWR